MIHPNIINPSSIVVVGASENIHTPGGKVLKNLLASKYKGKLYAVNPKFDRVQGVNCYQNLNDLPKVDLAIIAIAAKYCVATIKQLTEEKNTKGFIVFSAGFSEQDNAGELLEREMVALVNKVDGTLLGPNNIGLLNRNYTGIFTTPIPNLDVKGVDFISGSGATAVFIIEAAIAKGLSFNAVYSVGNSAQIGVEEVIEYLDNSFVKDKSSLIKLLYIESIKNPTKLLKHTRSLRKKGCRIAAIKAGSSEAGSRAASSHTGALSNADTAVDALFEKAGIIRCFGREELIYVAGVLSYKELQGKNIAIITHAGGPAVMLTDILSKSGLQIPKITSPKSKELKEKLFQGSSVTNPIDFLATGTAEQLEIIINYCDLYFEEIDAMVVIFGSPGLFNVTNVYEVLHHKIKTSKKPIYPVLPSVINASNEIEAFKNKGNVVFFDEVLFGKALSKTYTISHFEQSRITYNKEKRNSLYPIIKDLKHGYIKPAIIKKLFDEVGIPSVIEFEVKTQKELHNIEKDLNYPIVLKVVGVVHKTDIGGVRLNIKGKQELLKNFHSLMDLPKATGVLIQPMISGVELFIGAKREANFGHTIVVGLGGVLVELITDVSIGLAPLGENEINAMIKNLKAYPVLKGYRSKSGISIDTFISVIQKVSDLVMYLPEIVELDINPLLASENTIVAVDARIKL